ncbi:hypothetical protein CVU75_00235 [Candidatus Dependentiae bacterium HGW-Dependentiae-1]|nr:MAG: hypothetical protein CVU75_00235 [Candidatus Dependentiae bacterium HGW-Dependentiae-1]
MWPLPQLRTELVTIVLTPKTLTCGWIQQQKNARTFFAHTAQKQNLHTPHIHKKSATQPYILRAYEQTPLEQLQFAQGVLYNPTCIQKYIASFLQEHKLENAFIALSVSGDHILQRLITLGSAMPTQEQFPLPEKKNLRWDYRYLYPNQDGTFTFYFYGLPQELLLQYKLLAIATSLNLITITPSWATYLQLYKQLHGTTFSHSALAEAMNNIENIEQLISPEQLHNYCSLTMNTVPAPLKSLYWQENNQKLTTTDSAHETAQLACMLGLFITGNRL